MAAALFAGASSLWPLASDGQLDLAFWTALTVVTSSFPVRTPRGSVVSVSIAPILASGFFGGPTSAALVGFVGVIELRELRGEVPWYGTLYNHCSTLIAAVLAVSGYQMIVGAEPGWSVTALGAAMLAGLVFFVVAEVLAAASIAIRQGRVISAVMGSDIRSYGLTFLGLAPLAWLMAVTYELVGPFVALVFALPLYTTRAAYQSVVELRHMFTQTVRALASAIDARDPSTKRHSEHVSGIAVEIGQEMGVSEPDLEILEWGGLFHDIGKIGIPDAVLLKPGRLDREERIEMNRHPVKGAEILANADRLRAVVPLVRFHHEWYNGSGYPDRLIGDEIPLLARILAVADAFEAMTAVRPYQPRPKSLEQAIEELRKCAGTQFDPRVVAAFVRTRTARGMGEIAADPTRDLRPSVGDRPPLLPQNRPQAS
ncbi:MAG: HD-GYP domain-containing protein [Chloroflexota bacterium]